MDTFRVFRGDDWTLDFGVCEWDDGTDVSPGELAAASVRGTVAGIPVTPLIDPVSGVRMRIEVPREQTALMTTRLYRSDIEITHAGKRSTTVFEVFVQPDVTVTP
jgi:hypothetical protein